MNILLKICVSTLLIAINSIVFADNKFNYNLIQLLECKKDNNTYNDFLLNSQELLEKNDWENKGFKNLTSRSYISKKKPIIVFGMQTKEIAFTNTGVFAVFQNKNTEALAQKYQIDQHPFFKNKPYFSGEKIVKTDIAKDRHEKSFRKLSLMEILEDSDHPQEVYLGCQYMTESEHHRLEEAAKAWGQ